MRIQTIQIAVLTLMAGCSPNLPPDVVSATTPPPEASGPRRSPAAASGVETMLLRTDKGNYVAHLVERQGDIHFHAFEVVATITNLSGDTARLDVCGRGPRVPIHWVGRHSHDTGSAYNPNWACVGIDDRIVLPPGTSRADTLVLWGPTGWQGDQPEGAMTGSMFVGYPVETCRAEDCRTWSVRSNAFHVTVSPPPVHSQRR